MARIAEDLLLLLLDNAAAQPAIERTKLQRLLAAAVLLDLAHDCRVRPALATSRYRRTGSSRSRVHHRSTR